MGVDTLIDLCRNAIDKDYTTKPDITDWDSIYDLVTRNGVTAFVYDTISDMAMPRKIAISWALSAENIEARYRKQYSAAQHLSEMYRENGIRMMILKGIGLSRFYPRPETRECGDIDIYLFDGYEKGNELIGGKVSYHDKHAVFTFEGVNVENHYEFVHTYVEVQNDLKYLLDKYGVVDDGEFLFPAPEFDLVFTLRHAANHIREGIPLRQIIDWTLLLQKERERLNDEVREIIKRNGLDRLFDAMTSVAMRLTGEDFEALLFNRHKAEKYTDILLKIIEDKKWGVVKRTTFGKLFNTLSKRYYYRIVPERFLWMLWRRTKKYIRS